MAKVLTQEKFKLLIVVDDSTKEVAACDGEPPRYGCVACQREMSEKKACVYGALGGPPMGKDLFEKLMSDFLNGILPPL